MSKSISAPFRLVGGSVASTRDINEHTKDKLVNVLVTGKYERAGLAQYGAGIQQLIFSNIDELELADWKIDASSEIAQAVSGVQIIDIRVEQSSVTEAVVTVYYRTPLSSGESLSFNVPINETITEESPL